jgi:hypothetical protein
MRTAVFSAMALCILVATAVGQVRKVHDRYISIEIRSRDTTSEFEFEGITVLAKYGDTSFVVSRIEKHAPYRFNIGDAQACIAINGKSGRGKVYFKYKTSDEEKESMQYIAAGEKLMVSWAPPGAMGPGTSWISHTRLGGPPGDELAVWSSMKE